MPGTTIGLCCTLSMRLKADVEGQRRSSKGENITANTTVRAGEEDTGENLSHEDGAAESHRCNTSTHARKERTACRTPTHLEDRAQKPQSRPS